MKKEQLRSINKTKRFETKRKALDDISVIDWETGTEPREKFTADESYVDGDDGQRLPTVRHWEAEEFDVIMFSLLYYQQFVSTRRFRLVNSGYACRTDKRDNVHKAIAHVFSRCNRITSEKSVTLMACRHSAFTDWSMRRSDVKRFSHAPYGSVSHQGRTELRSVSRLAAPLYTNLGKWRTGCQSVYRADFYLHSSPILKCTNGLLVVSYCSTYIIHVSSQILSKRWH